MSQTTNTSTESDSKRLNIEDTTEMSAAKIDTIANGHKEHVIASAPKRKEILSDAEAVREFTIGAGQPAPDHPVTMSKDQVFFLYVHCYSYSFDVHLIDKNK